MDKKRTDNSAQKGRGSACFYNTLDISIYQIQLFLTVAEERNFSRAAACMNLEQPTLSKRISSLEQILDMRLFTRGTRPIKLTNEGKVLYSEWKDLIERFEDSIDKAYECRQKNDNKLKVCPVDSLNVVNVMPHISRQMISIFPEISLSFEYESFSRWRTKMIHNEIDVVFSILFEIEGLDDAFEWELITSCPKAVCMLKTNPLAQKDSISISDLEDQEFIMISPVESSAYSEYVKAICRCHGFEPTVSKYVLNAHALISNILNKNEVLICDQYLRDFHNPLIKSFELPEIQSGIAAIWKKDNTNPYIEPFNKFLKEYYSRHHDYSSMA